MDHAELAYEHMDVPANFEYSIFPADSLDKILRTLTENCDSNFGISTVLHHQEIMFIGSASNMQADLILYGVREL